MDDRITRLEEGQEQLREAIGKVERQMERVATNLEKLVRFEARLDSVFTRLDAHDEEIHELRRARHDHGNIIQIVPMLKERFDHLEATLEKALDRIADNRAATAKVAGSVALIVSLVVGMVLALVRHGL